MNRQIVKQKQANTNIGKQTNTNIGKQDKHFLKIKANFQINKPAETDKQKTIFTIYI